MLLLHWGSKTKQKLGSTFWSSFRYGTWIKQNKNPTAFLSYLLSQQNMFTVWNVHSQYKAVCLLWNLILNINSFKASILGKGVKNLCRGSFNLTSESRKNPGLCKSKINYNYLLIKVFEYLRRFPEICTVTFSENFPKLWQDTLV